MMREWLFCRASAWRLVRREKDGGKVVSSL